MKPTRYRVRFNLTVANGLAMEEANGLYISVQEHEEDVAEAVRLLQAAVAMHPLPMTDPMRRDAHRWLTAHTP